MIKFESGNLYYIRKYEYSVYDRRGRRVLFELCRALCTLLHGHFMLLPARFYQLSGIKKPDLCKPEAGFLLLKLKAYLASVLTAGAAAATAGAACGAGA